MTALPARTLSVAPMLDWTDRHYRFLARLITRYAWLYTEMIHANALIHGNAPKLLAHAPQEHPIVLQLGGSEPHLLAQAAHIATVHGFDEINLNCGCPSERVQQGAFGACLMREAHTVSGCLKAMQDSSGKPVSVKHRIGLDKEENYAFVRDFVGQVAHESDCRIFVVHARNAWLKGLSPKENRTIPPLRYDFVYALKHDFPDLHFILNGGVRTRSEIAAHLAHTDGVMVGREAYHHPMSMQSWDEAFYGGAPGPSLEAVVGQLNDYVNQQLTEGVPLRKMCRHYLGLLTGESGARHWRRQLSSPAVLARNAPDTLWRVWQEVQAA